MMKQLTKLCLDRTTISISSVQFQKPVSAKQLKRLHVTNDPRVVAVTKDQLFLGDEGVGHDNIQYSKHNKFWDKSEDDSGKESEGDVETFWDKHEDESGEESEKGYQSIVLVLVWKGIIIES